MTLHEMMKSGSDLLLDVLHQEGVRYIFGNPGTTEMPILHSLRNQPDMDYVLGLQETSVVAMADGYAKASGKPGVVNLHTAGGLGHAMGALLHSQIARTPLLVTAGQQDTRHSFSDPLLYGDIQRMAEPAAKWSREILHPNHIPALVRRGLQETQAPPRGPVVLSLPSHRSSLSGRLSELWVGTWRWSTRRRQPCTMSAASWRELPFVDISLCEAPSWDGDCLRQLVFLLVLMDLLWSRSLVMDLHFIHHKPYGQRQKGKFR